MEEDGEDQVGMVKIHGLVRKKYQIAEEWHRIGTITENRQKAQCCKAEQKVKEEQVEA